MELLKLSTYTNAMSAGFSSLRSLLEIPFSFFKEKSQLSTQKTAEISSYRAVFQTTSEMKKAFSSFLQTIFFQLDEKKVLALMDEILADPTKDDQKIYTELLKKIDSTKKPLSLFSQLHALSVVRSGVGRQAAELLEPFTKSALSNYMEIYNRRYAAVIQKKASLSFKETTAVCDKTSISMLDRIEAGSFLYPYKKSLPLNNLNCQDPEKDVELTYKPIGEDVKSQSLDLIACLGGFHHIPQDRLEPFIQSLYDKLRPGAVLLLRDHDAKNQKIKDIATVVHSFVNASNGLSSEKEALEIRNFQPESFWQNLLEKNGFTRIDPKSLVLKDDPTQNAMTAFVKTPKKALEVEVAAFYQKQYLRSKIGSYATWIEWGNVRFSKQYAAFIQNHHAYAFDFIGHIYQHWTHFYYMMKKSLEQPDVKLFEVLFSDNMLMNLFILMGTTMQLGISALVNAPAALIAKWRHGEKWREIHNLSALEKFEAQFQKDYSDFIDYSPFYKYPYFKTIRDMWKTVISEKQGFPTKILDIASAITSTVTIGVQGLASSFIDYLYYSQEETSDLETIQVLIDDPKDQLGRVIKKWNHWKDGIEFRGQKPYEKCEIKVLYSAEGRKLVSVPFYKPFTKFSEILAQNSDLQLLKVGGQETITMDICLSENEKAPEMTGAKLIYGMDRLQDPTHKKYKTYEVETSKLQKFC